MPPAPAPTTPHVPNEGQKDEADAITSKSPDADAQPRVPHPGTIRINVQGAFIVDEEPSPFIEPVDGGAGGEAPGAAAASAEEDDDEIALQHDTKDIRLPNQKAVVSHVAIDIGGSLAKLVFFSHEPGRPQDGGRLNFLKFESDRVGECIELIRKLQVRYHRGNGDADAGARGRAMSVMATGGGAFKYYDDIKNRLGVEVQREDEMECLIIGLDFFLTEIPNEVFTHTPSSPPTFLPPRPPSSIYPYLLINIGSGVSMIKVSSPTSFTRIGGTSLGGGTLWGLLSLLTGARSFDAMLALADKGDNAKVDMLVGDIYGEGMGYEKIGLKAETIASSFGKVYRMKREAEEAAEDGAGLARGESRVEVDPATTAENDPPLDDAPPHAANPISFQPADISRSLLYAISYNIAHLAYLHSSIQQISHLYFGGSFIRGHRQTMDTLAYAIRYWSKGEKQAFFLRHEGFLGATGAFLKGRPLGWGRRGSFDGKA